MLYHNIIKSKKKNFNNFKRLTKYSRISKHPGESHHSGISIYPGESHHSGMSIHPRESNRELHAIVIF